MYANLAQLGLALSVIIAFILPTLMLVFKSKFKERLNSLVNQIILAQYILISFAFLSLSYAYIVSDFSLLNVFRNSHIAMPLLYKISGLWSNHEGSMLLWVFLLSFCNIISTRHRMESYDRIWFIMVQIMLTSSLVAYILLKSNPFIKIFPVPEQGIGFNPLLQDIGLAIHPPILYIGYVTTSIAFVISIVALVRKKISSNLLEIMQIWNLFSWNFLTLGIALGSWWAYRELGWGGYWFWDPVENASLLPWLISSALMHSVYATKKLDTNYKWTILLGLTGFLVAMLSTFLVRSGIVTSVHSFASDPNRGIFILGLLASYAGTALILFATRVHMIKSSSGYSWISRFGGINFGNILWCIATIILLISLLYPLFLAVSTGKQISIERGFFENSFIPSLFGILFFLAFMLPASWHNILSIHYRHFIYSFIVAVIFTVGFYYFSALTPSYISLAAFFMGMLVIIRMCLWMKIKDNPSIKFWSIWLVHIAAGLFTIVIAFLETNSQELTVSLNEGSKVSFADFTVSFAKKENIAENNYLAGRVILYLEKDNSELAILTPEIRYYPVEKAQTSEASVYHGILYDFYSVISELSHDGKVIIRFYFKPLISWVWFISGLIFACGILLLILNVRKRSRAHI